MCFLDMSMRPPPDVIRLARVTRAIDSRADGMHPGILGERELIAAETPPESSESTDS